MSPEEYGSAEPMTLRCDAASVLAIGYTEGLLETLPWARPVYQKASTGKRRTAIRALVADLLRLEARGKAGYHGTHTKDFPAKVLGFSHDVFSAAREAMVAAGLLTFEAGSRRWTSMSNAETGERGDLVQRGGFQARFRLTQKALRDLADAGIALEAWEEHWSPPTPLQSLQRPAAPPAAIIELRAAKVEENGRKAKGAFMPVDLTEPALKPLVEDLEAHNDFMRGFGVDGVDFIGLRRIFNDGDRPGFAWNFGGRFYSLRAPGMGKAYETLPGDKRRRRIKLGGRPVAEADMSASQLRLLYALMGEGLAEGYGEDLYSTSGAHRDAVKAVVTQAIGKESVQSKKWGPEAVRDYAKERPGRSLSADHPFADAQAATLKAHPILERLGASGVPTALELQFREAEVIRRAMASLRAQGIGSLPVHDSLIVPREHSQAAVRALQEAFRNEVEEVIGLPTSHRPTVKVKKE